MGESFRVTGDLILLQCRIDELKSERCIRDKIKEQEKLWYFFALLVKKCSLKFFLRNF